MNIGDTVKFSYIDTDNEPATRDTDTIYFDSNTKKISVGDVKFDGGTVPTPTSGDNGKILIAGEEGAFDWGQPPEELPVITEGDEGKVLKVDEGVPKWLEDQDAEIPSHTASDEGKMLSVNAQNELEWKTVSFEQKCKSYRIQANGNNYTIVDSDVTIQSIANELSNGTYVILRGNANASSNDILIPVKIGASKQDVMFVNINLLSFSSESDAYPSLKVYTKGSNDTSLSLFTKKTLNIPVPTAANKILTSLANGKTFWGDIPKELPTATSADEGKVLMVDSNGDYVLGTVSGGYVVPYSIDSATFSDNAEVPNNA